MDDCGAVLHNIETKWLYDFLTLEKCRNFSQAAVSRNVSQPAFSRRIRALEQAIGVELFNRQVTPLQLSEQGKIFHSQIRHLLQQLESNLAELRGGSDYAQRKIKVAAAHSLSLGLLPSIISQMPPLFTWAIEAIDVDEAVDKLREGQSDCIFSFHDEDLLEAPFDHIRVFESQLFPVCASDEHGEALFNLAQPHFPLLNYSRNSYMGRLINRTLTRHSVNRLNRPGFPGECFICELRLPDQYFRWKHNKLFLLLPEEYGPAFPAIVDCYTSPPTLVWPVPLLSGFSNSYGVLPPLCKDH